MANDEEWTEEDEERTEEDKERMEEYECGITAARTSMRPTRSTLPIPTA